MTVRRLVAIAVIFVGTSIAWSVLGESLIERTARVSWDDLFDAGVVRESGHASRS